MKTNTKLAFYLISLMALNHSLSAENIQPEVKKEETTKQETVESAKKEVAKKVEFKQLNNKEKAREILDAGIKTGALAAIVLCAYQTFNNANGAIRNTLETKVATFTEKRNLIFWILTRATTIYSMIGYCGYKTLKSLQEHYNKNFPTKIKKEKEKTIPRSIQID